NNTILPKMREYLYISATGSRRVAEFLLPHESESSNANSLNAKQSLIEGIRLKKILPNVITPNHLTYWQNSLWITSKTLPILYNVNQNKEKGESIQTDIIYLFTKADEQDKAWTTQTQKSVEQLLFYESVW